MTTSNAMERKRPSLSAQVMVPIPINAIVEATPEWSAKIMVYNYYA